MSNKIRQQVPASGLVIFTDTNITKFSRAEQMRSGSGARAEF